MDPSVIHSDPRGAFGASVAPTGGEVRSARGGKRLRDQVRQARGPVLASDAARCITGQVVDASGGLLPGPRADGGG
jgi:hypothetical protein